MSRSRLRKASLDQTNIKRERGRDLNVASRKVKASLIFVHVTFSNRSSRSISTVQLND